MKMLPADTRSQSGFTVAELSVAVGVLGLLGIVFFQVLQSGLTLSAKNTAVNAAHEQARQGVLRLVRDIHASVSVPQLRDTSFAVVDSLLSPSASASATPPTAAGVSFQNIVPGCPDYVWQDPGNPSMIMIKDNGGQPVPGMRMILPAWGIEDNIVKDTGASVQSHSNVFTEHALETNIKNPKTFGGTAYAITYYTNRMMYLVKNGTFVADTKGDHNLVSGQYVQVTPGTGSYHYENGELHLYQQRYANNAFYWSDVATVARNLSSPKPFSVPLNRYRGQDNKYVKVQLSARDPKSTNRGYIATAALLDTSIDYRSRLTVFQ
jgi:type II secretory pathway pseudopilin PulG